MTDLEKFKELFKSIGLKYKQITASDVHGPVLILEKVGPEEDLSICRFLF
jgi:hypothetical protein